MKGKLLAAACVAALGLVAPAAAGADSANTNGIGNCHGKTVLSVKSVAGTHSGAETAAFYGVTVQQGQEMISESCGQS
jgi:hypothetical protein